MTRRCPHYEFRDFTHKYAKYSLKTQSFVALVEPRSINQIAMFILKKVEQ